MMIRMVAGWVFLLVPAHPGSRGQRAVKRSLLFCTFMIINWFHIIISGHLKTICQKQITRLPWAYSVYFWELSYNPFHVAMDSDISHVLWLSSLLYMCTHSQCYHCHQRIHRLLATTLQLTCFMCLLCTAFDVYLCYIYHTCHQRPAASLSQSLCICHCS